MNRYQRQILLDEIGQGGQAKIWTSSVLVLGCGGLGCPIAMYLAGAGVGRLGVIDCDKVALSNLHRQILYTTKDVGNFKTTCAQQNLQKLNPDVNIETFNLNINSQNINQIAQKYDILIDGLDNPDTRYIIDNISKNLQKPYVYGGIEKYVGQVSVFNYNNGPSYSSLFPVPKPQLSDKTIKSGVIGTLPGIIGCLQANEVLKIITGFGEVLSGKLLEYDIRTNSQMIFNFDSR